jgi:hypothetical protein
MRRAIIALLLLASCSADAAAPTVEAELPSPPTTASAASSTTAPGAPSVPGSTAPPSVTSTGPPRPTTTRTIPTTAVAPTSTTVPPEEAPRGDWFSIAVTARLPDGFAAALRELPGVLTVSEVWVGNARVVRTTSAAGDVVDQTRARFVIPVEVQAFDPEAHGGFVPPTVAAALAALESGEVLLGSSSARLRRLGPGATLTLEDGTILSVSGVVADEWVGFAEVVTTSPDPAALGADRPRYAVVRYRGTREELAIAAQTLTDKTVTVRAEGEVPVFRHADPVQPQVRIKERFGEFSYRRTRSGRVEIDPAWVEANIVTVELPLIGSVRCHRDFAAALGVAMEALREGGHGSIVTPGSDGGCFHPRFIAGRRDLSRHSWGIAADINWGNDADGPRSPSAPPLVAAMRLAGLTSGHDWADPDPGHFEWLEDP